MKASRMSMGVLRVEIGFLVVISSLIFTSGQNYEVADIDCAIGTGGKELLTARLRRPDGFRGNPIFADDRGQGLKEPLVIPQELLLVDDVPCQIANDPTDPSGRVFKLRITDFSQCGVMKRNGFIHVRVWFPQLAGVVMLSDQEVIIMCKPPAATIVQSKTAGFAGSIPSGARISGVVEESPGRLEYEVALYRETNSPPSLAGRSSSPGGGAFITGADSHELPVDQAVPIGTRLQLRAKINPDSAWKHAKLMEVSVSPDPKNPNAEGSVALVREGCRNPDLASIIPKQPYRYKERTNEVVLDFEAFLLSNMADRSTLWLHTQIKACMESQDCHPEFCMDVYQPSGYGRKRRSLGGDDSMTVSSSISVSKSNATSMDYSAPLSHHWTAYADEIIIDNEPKPDQPEHRSFDFDMHMPKMINKTLNLNKNRVMHRGNLFSLPIPNETVVRNEEREKSTTPKMTTSSTTKMSTSTTTTMKSKPIKTPKKSGTDDNNIETTKFGDNIGFSVIMPSDYYRSADILSTEYECRAWATATLASIVGAVVAILVACTMSYKMKNSTKSIKDKPLYSIQLHGNGSSGTVPVITATKDQLATFKGQQQHKYARDTSIYRS